MNRFKKFWFWAVSKAVLTHVVLSHIFLYDANCRGWWRQYKRRQIFVSDEVVSFELRLTTSMVKYLPAAVEHTSRGKRCFVITEFAAQLPQEELDTLLFREFFLPKNYRKDTDDNVRTAKILGSRANMYLKQHHIVLSLLEKENVAIQSCWYMRYKNKGRIGQSIYAVKRELEFMD